MSGKKMDLSFWKAFFMWTSGAAGVYVVVAGLLATHFQTLIDRKKETEHQSRLDQRAEESRQQLESLRSESQRQSEQLRSQVGSLESKLDPFLAAARKRFPKSPDDEALRRLQAELTEVR